MQFEEVGRSFLCVPVREEHWVQAEVFGRGCWHSLFAGLLAMPTPVWLLNGQAGAITKPASLEEEIKILGHLAELMGLFF